MTRKVFWDDPYQTQLATQITAVYGDEVTVAATIFYALAGGQESDEGMFNHLPVQQARKDGLEIYYTLPVDHALTVGTPLTMTIDWERRYRLMRLHFAAELVLELTYRRLNPIEKIGAHIAPDKARIDFAWGESIALILPELQAQTHTLIAANHPIISAFSDAEQERRYWEIAGFARVACGGTHLKTTGEVGAITLKRKNVGKGKERIEIYLASE